MPALLLPLPLAKPAAAGRHAPRFGWRRGLACAALRPSPTTAPHVHTCRNLLPGNVKTAGATVYYSSPSDTCYSKIVNIASSASTAARSYGNGIGTTAVSVPSTPRVDWDGNGGIIMMSNSGAILPGRLPSRSGDSGIWAGSGPSRTWVNPDGTVEMVGRKLLQSGQA